ncbi:MAG TPA: hypothetical protein VFI75_02270 [Candidatus Acidoferrum sp.]|nr:hypothetical protein [Candidatus Acidoferrum sp.]
MRKVVFFLILACGAPPGIFAQRYSDSEVPRFELGAWFDFAHIERVSDALGVGASLHYNFNRHYALDSQFAFGPVAASAGGAEGQTKLLVGVRAGQRVEDYGFFLHARGGFVNYSRANGGQPLFSRDTFPAFDVGGTLENYFGSFPNSWKKNMVFRLEVGALIVPYGRATLTPSSSPSIGSSPPPSGPLGTRVGPVLGLGIGIRF